MAHVKDFQTFAIGYPEVSELNRGGARVVKRNSRRKARLQRLVEIDDDQTRIGRDVRVIPRQRDVSRAIQHASWVPRDRALDKVVARVAIGERLDINEDQTLWSL